MKKEQKYIYSEQNRLWQEALQGQQEKALQEAIYYVGLYHLAGRRELRDSYAKLAKEIENLSS